MAFNIQSANVSNTATANTDLSVTISPSAAVVTVNSTFTFTATVVGGISPYQYSWTLFDNCSVPVAHGTGNPWNCTVPKWAYVGLGEVNAIVTDSQGNLNYTSEPVLILAISVSVSPASVKLDSGQSQAFRSSVLGGTSPFSYEWYLDDNPVLGAASSLWTYTPSSAGSHSVYSKVTDAAGLTATSNTVSVKVNPMLSVSISPSSVTLDVGQSRLFISTVTGGTSAYSYQWYVNGSAVSGATNSTWTFTPSSSGSYTVYARVTDSASIPDAAQSNTASVRVNDALSVTITPIIVIMDVGQSQLFSSSGSGGTSPYGYQWCLKGGAVSDATSSSWAFTPASAGPYTVFLNVTDSLGFKVESNTVNVTVNSALVAPSVTSSPDIVDQGQTTVLSNSTAISTGTPSYSYQWFDEAPNASSYSLIIGATSFNYSFSTTTSTGTGSWSFLLRVTDATGATVNSTAATVTVYFSVTFAQIGFPAGTLWNATFNGITKSSNASQIVFTGIAPGNYSWSVGTPILGGVGIRYTASSPSGFLNVSTQTVRGITFTSQYYLMVSTSPVGVYSPTGQGWYNSGANVIVSTAQYVDATSGSRYRFDSWTGASGGYSGALVVMNSAEAVIANYVLQYKLTVASGYGSPAPSVGDHWYDAGAYVNASVTSPADQSGGTRYRCTGYNGSGSVSSGSGTSVSFSIIGPSTLTWNWIAQYKLTMAANFGTTSPSVGDNWYDASTTVCISATAPSVINGERYVWLNWTGSESGSYSGTVKTPSVTMNGPIKETAFWIHEYLVTFAVSPLGGGTTTPSDTNVWENAGALSISATQSFGYMFLSCSTTWSIMVEHPSSSCAIETIRARAILVIEESY